MNRVVKGFIIAACICIILGIAITVGAVAAGGLGVTKQMAENGELNYGLSWNDRMSTWHWGWNSDDDDGDFFDDGAEIYKSDRSESFDADTIDNLDIKIGAARIEISSTSEDTIEVSTKGIKSVQIYSEDGRLCIKGLKSHHTEGGTIYIAIPDNKKFDGALFSVGASDAVISALNCDNLDMEVGAGQLLIDKLTAENSNIQVGAGKMSIQNADCQNVNIEVGMGDFNLAGSITGNLTGECGMGNFTMALTGKETDHNYDLECAAGNMRIGNNNYAGLASERVIDNGAASNFELDCSMGNFAVTFEGR